MNYKLHYDLLITKANNRGWIKKLAPCYVEQHHIIPHCMGGSNKKENITCLSYREHCLAHLLLTRIYPQNYKLLCAAKRMYVDSKNHPRGENNKMMSTWLKEEHARAASIFFSGKRKSPFTEEHKKNLSMSHIGLRDTDETKLKKSIAKKNNPNTLEQIQKIAVALRGRKANPGASDKKVATRMKNGSYTTSDSCKELRRINRANQAEIHNVKVCMFGVNYPSVKDALTALGRSRTFMMRRINSEEHPDCYYL